MLPFPEVFTVWINISRRDHYLNDGGISSIAVPLIFRSTMFVQISGRLFNDEQLLRSSSQRDSKLMMIGRAFSFEQPFICNLCKQWRFPIEEGSFSRLEHPLRYKSWRLVRFPIEEGSSTRLEHLLRFNCSKWVIFPIEKGSSTRLEHPMRHNSLRLVIFPIKEGSSTRLEQHHRSKRRRLMAVERSGSSFRFLASVNFNHLRFLIVCTENKDIIKTDVDTYFMQKKKNHYQ